jgi:pimeloyl-ACP methyl ester carboxylesterase
MHADARGKGDAVLLIHGMPTNGRLWDGVVRELSRRCKCIVIDLPGMGDTPFLPYGPSYFAQMAAQIEQIRIRYQVQHWHVVGHDGGSAIAVQYAHLFPQRVDCLALLSPAVFPDLQPFFLLDLLRKPVLGELSAPLVNTVFWRFVMTRAVPGPHNEGQRKSFFEAFSGIAGPWKLMRLVRWGEPGVVFREFPAILKNLQCPALVIHGSRDVLPESFARRAAGLIPNSQLIALDSGHFIPIERAAQVSQHPLAFFRSHGAEKIQDSSHLHDSHPPSWQTGFGDARPQVNLVPRPVAQ